MVRHEKIYKFYHTCMVNMNKPFLPSSQTDRKRRRAPEDIPPPPRRRFFCGAFFRTHFCGVQTQEKKWLLCQGSLHVFSRIFLLSERF